MSVGPMQIKVRGKPIDLRLNVGRVMFGSQNGSDLGDLEDGPVTRMFLDPSLLAKTIWDVYRDRIEEAGVEDESAFMELVDGDMVRSIESAMRVVIPDFFTAWGATIMQRIESKLATMDQTMDAIDQGASGPSSGDVPELSASTQPG